VYQLVTFLKDECSKTRRSRKIKIDFTTSGYKLKTNGPAKICSNNGQLSIESPNNTNYAYQWYRDGQLLNNVTGFALTATQGGSYWAVLKDAKQGCSSRSDTVTVKTVTAATVGIVSSNGTQLCTATTTILSAQNNAIGSYQWSKDGQTLPNETKSTITVSQVGSYGVAAIDTNGCTINAPIQKIEIVSKITVALDSLPSFCGVDFQPVMLKGTPTGGVYAGVGVSNSQFSPRAAGIGTHIVTYTVKGTLDCQNGEAKRNVTITPPPVLNLGNDREIFKGSSVELNGDLGTGYGYVWTPPFSLSNPNAGRTTATPDKTTTYTLQANGPNGCTAKDTITIRVITVIYVPDVFTPNADGSNDVWVLRGLDNYPDVEVRVFSRWGTLVFYGKGSNQPAFDGTMNNQLLPTGVYTYVINANENQVFRGSITILR
jgi:gliding motility-associated-like protein